MIHHYSWPYNWLAVETGESRAPAPIGSQSEHATYSIKNKEVTCCDRREELRLA